MFHEPREMRMVNNRNAPPAVFDVLAGEVSLSRYLPFPSSRAGSMAPPWEPPATEAGMAALWVGAIALLARARPCGACAATASTAGSRASRCRSSLFLALSLAVDYVVRPGGPPRVAPPAAMPSAGGAP